MRCLKEGALPDLSDRRLSRPTSASFMTARLGNAALVIAPALALGIAGDLTLAASAGVPTLADTDPQASRRTVTTESHATCETAQSPAERANAERSCRLHGCTEGVRCMRSSHDIAVPSRAYGVEHQARVISILYIIPYMYISRVISNILDKISQNLEGSRVIGSSDLLISRRFSSD